MKKPDKPEASGNPEQHNDETDRSARSGHSVPDRPVSSESPPENAETFSAAQPWNSVFELPSSGRAIIEANAGTGKTYTIAALYIKLVIEKKLSPAEMVVMTFTRKATAELRERIFSRLNESLALFEEGDWDREDTFLNDLNQHITDRSAAIGILRSAIADFDDHQVTTIHGFCQKVLREEALLTGTLFGFEVEKEDTRLQVAAEEYWREFIGRYQNSEAGIYRISKLLQLAKTPAELQRILKPLFAKPYAVVEADLIYNPDAYLEELVGTRILMRQIWQESRAELMEIFHDSPIKNFNRYLDSRVAKLEAFLTDENYTVDAIDQLKYFKSDYLYDPGQLLSKRKNERHPRHRFFDLCNRYLELAEETDKVKVVILHEAWKGIKEKVERSANALETISHNDSLKLLSDALSEGSRARALAAKLRRSYPVALVDEFQDTDPLQFNILDKIYARETGSDQESAGAAGVAGGTDFAGGAGVEVADPAAPGNEAVSAKRSPAVLYMIGDPKQAIYGFRGGDVYTYFQARKSLVGPAYSLGKNYRSTTELIGAVNALFGRESGLFHEKEIRFFPSGKGEISDQPIFRVSGESGSQLRFLLSEEFQGNKGVLKEKAFEYTARRTRYLLDQAAEGKVRLGEKPLEAGDIAILISRHADAGVIKKKLKTLGVDAVIYSKENVYSTFEASRLRVVLEAINHPLSRKHRHRALLSGFFGFGIPELYERTAEVQKKEDFTQLLFELRSAWESAGFYFMFRKLLFEQEAMIHLSRLDDSERVLANLSHLAEMLSVIEMEEGLNPQELLQRFVREIRQAEQDEEKALLLESDRNLVVICTIHSSKGLQYPVVLCPTLWEGASDARGLLEYHSEEDLTLAINMDHHPSEAREKAAQKQQQEAIAEEIRKAYVAVTRAQHYCEVIWSSHSNSWKSGIGRPLLGEKRFMDLQSGRVKASEDLVWMAGEAAEELTGFADPFIETRSLDHELDSLPSATGYRPGAGEKAYPFDPYKGRGELPVQTLIESFTSLARQGSSHPYEPDYDQLMEQFAGAFQAEERSKPGFDSIFSFPKGATPGTAIHKFFELDQFLFREAAARDYTAEIETILQEFGIDPAWTPVFQKMVREVSGAVIPGLDLRGVGTGDQLKEMEFLFKTGSVAYAELMSILRRETGEGISGQGSGKVSGSAWQVGVAGGGAGQRRDGSSGYEPGRYPSQETGRLERHERERVTVKGIADQYMTGFIDLIVCQDNRYYIIDYKSNYLGDTPEDYSQESLREEILRSDYDLQYHIYVVALVKYLRERVTGFRYDEHFGGVAYLFVRGMEAGTDRGVWFHKPREEVIRALELRIGNGELKVEN